MTNNERKRGITKLRQQLGLETVTAYLGNGSGDVRDRTKPGYYYVRFTQAGGTLTKPVSLQAAPNANLPVTDGLPITVGYDASGKQVILQANVQALAETGANALQFNPLDNQYAEFVGQNQIATFYATRHADTDNKPFYAVVFPGIYYNDTDELSLFLGGNIDLSGFQPSAGEHCYTVVFLATDGTLEAFASTPINDNDLLTIEDIQEAVASATTGSIPVWAWAISGDDTVLTVDPARGLDLRRFVSANTGSGGASIIFTAAPTSIFDVTGSPGDTIALSMDNQSANTVLGGPSSGGAATPAFRALVSDDIPNLSAAKITSGTLVLARGGTGADLSATGPGALVQASSGAVVTVETLAATRGGTAQTTYTTGDTLYASAANTLSKLAIGTAGFFYKVVAGIPAWAAIVSADISDLATTLAAYITKATLTAKGDIISASASATPAIRSVGSNNQVLIADSGQTSGLNWATTPVSSLFQHFADAGNTGTAETDLYSDTTPAGTFANNGDVINATYSGIFVSSATATRQIKAYFGGTAIFDSGALSISVSDSWDCRISIIRESSTVVRCDVDLKVGGVSVTVAPTYTRITGLTLSGTNILKITGTAAGVGAATNDIVAKFGVVLLPASASALGANTALSNLASTAINTSLISDTDNTDALGSRTIKWSEVDANFYVLEEGATPSTPSSGDVILYAFNGSGHHLMGVLRSDGTVDFLQTAQAIKRTEHQAITTSPGVTLVSATISGNYLNASGWVRTRVFGTILNNSGAGRVYTFTYTFGSFTQTVNTASMAASSTNRLDFQFEIWTLNNTSSGEQEHRLYMVNKRDTAGVFGIPGQTLSTWNTSSVDTTANVAVSVTLQSPASTATQTVRAAGMIEAYSLP